MIDKFIIDKINFIRNNKINNNKNIIDLNSNDWELIDKIMKNYKIPHGKGYISLFEICIFIGMMIGVSINLEDKYFIMGCS